MTESRPNRSFNDRPFVAGSLIGLRAFKVMGKHLVGPAAPAEFVPGENIAVCQHGTAYLEWRHDVSEYHSAWRNNISISGVRMNANMQITADPHFAGRARGRLTGAVGIPIPAVLGSDIGETLRVARYVPPEVTPGSRPIEPIVQLATDRMLNHLASMIGGKAAKEMAMQMGLNTIAASEYIHPMLVDQYELEERKGEPIMLQRKYPKYPWRALHEKNPNHQPGVETCSCGYYAYYESHHTTHFEPSTCVQAIIEGYGLVTVGDKGFRAGKARLLALIGPTTEQWRESDKVRFRDFTSLRLHEQLKSTRVRGNQHVPANMARRYQVPVFATLEQALQEYPLTNPNELGLESE